MTKQEFLEGVRFRLPGSTIKASADYCYKDGGRNSSYILKNYISSSTGNILLEDCEANIEEVSEKGFIAFSFVIGKYVQVSYKFKDLTAVTESNNVVVNS